MIFKEMQLNTNLGYVFLILGSESSVEIMV